MLDVNSRSSKESCKIPKKSFSPIRGRRIAARSAQCVWNIIFADMKAESPAIAWIRVDSFKALRGVHAHLHLSQRQETPETDWGDVRDGGVE